MKAIQAVIRHLFYLLYHQFAFSYDLVASIVSLGHWNGWIKTVLPLVQGGTVLELGFGPGHLQLSLNQAGFDSYGVDESRQMIKLACRRLKTHGFPDLNLTRGLTHQLPFQSGRFNAILSTFPSEYIFEKQTQEEIYRVLTEEGRLIILPAVWYRGGGFLERIMAWIFKVTGETPGVLELFKDRYKEKLESFQFNVEAIVREQGSNLLLILIATKNPNPNSNLNTRP